LRFVSGQACLSSNPTIFGFTVAELITTDTVEGVQEAGFVRTHILQSAIRPEHIQAADAAGDPDDSPYLNFLLDAADGVVAQDYRRAILYSATAMDAAARAVFEMHAEAARTGRQSDPTLRFRIAKDGP